MTLNDQNFEIDERFGIPEGVERVLVVTAHPDDVDFGAGGTIATLTELGIAVSYCICTDGDAGGFDDATDRSQIPSIRRAEQIAAGKVLGVTDVNFLGYKDGYLEPNHDVQKDIVRIMRRVKPQLVITQTPERNWERLPATQWPRPVGAATRPGRSRSGTRRCQRPVAPQSAWPGPR